MRSAPRKHASPHKHASEEALYAAALRALMRRSYSVFEMRTYLERRAEEPAQAHGVVARLREKGLIDDARYALEFTRRHAQVRSQGRYRIERELRARGVADRHIAAAVEQAFGETDERLIVRKLIERRLRGLRATEGRGTLDRKRLASLYRMLLRAGFDAALIHRELNVAARARVAEELPEGDFAESDS